MLQSHSFYSLNPGPRLLVLGAVHGNEKCGTIAIRRMISDIEGSRVTMERGSVTFVPICNPGAYQANTRWVDRNLNRFLVPQEAPDSYEAQIGNVLCPLLERCDFLLDLHSYHLGQGSFVYVGNPGSKEHDFANSLGAEAGITGWADAYAASSEERPKTLPNESTGTTEYARKFGVIAATIECGQHTDPSSPLVGYEAISGALKYLEIASGLVSRPTVSPAELVSIKRVFYRQVGGSLTREWEELDPVREGDVIAVREDGEKLTAPGDGVIILPNADAAKGAEWFYWGQRNSGIPSAPNPG